MAEYSTEIVEPLAFPIPDKKWVALVPDEVPSDLDNGTAVWIADYGEWFYVLNGGLYQQGENVPLKIAVTTIPTTSTQYEGATFDKTGMVVTVTYYTDDVEPADVTESCDIPTPVLGVGNNNIVISYTENGITRRCIYVQEGTANDLNSIAVTTAPTKVAYNVGELFDPDGAKITASFKNGTTEVIYPVDSRLTWDLTEPLETTDVAATFTVTIGETAKTATQAITVTDPDEE